MAVAIVPAPDIRGFAAAPARSIASFPRWSVQRLQRSGQQPPAMRLSSGLRRRFSCLGPGNTRVNFLRGSGKFCTRRNRVVVTLREFEGAVVIERHVGRRPQEALSADNPFQLDAPNTIRPGFQRKFYPSDCCGFRLSCPGLPAPNEHVHMQAPRMAFCGMEGNDINGLQSSPEEGIACQSPQTVPNTCVGDGVGKGNGQKVEAANPSQVVLKGKEKSVCPFVPFLLVWPAMEISKFHPGSPDQSAKLLTIRTQDLPCLGSAPRSIPEIPLPIVPDPPQFRFPLRQEPIEFQCHLLPTDV